MILPTYEEVLKLKEQGNVIAVSKAVMADLLTPVSAFAKVAHNSTHAFLLESIEGGEKIARYSFIGHNPFLILQAQHTRVTLTYQHRQETIEGNSIEVLRTLSKKYTMAPVPLLPPFTAGGVGYFAYDVIRLFERIPDKVPDDLGLDDVTIMFFGNILVFDHVKHQIHIISNIFVEEGQNSLRSKYESAVAQIAHLEKQLHEPITLPGLVETPTQHKNSPSITSNLTKAQFESMVVKAKEYIRAGDIFQVVLSQRYEVNTSLDPFSIYRALRVVNPSPYMFFLKMGPLAIAGASPEMLVRVMGKTLEYRPIAGTRPRGRTEAEDAMLMEELKNDEKEKAEHTMLVDLGRNDLGRVSDFGSVRVREFMFIEKYSHVMHLVSSLEGTLRPDLERFDAFVSCFPAGTVSGAPKVRAMEIIEELEPSKRRVYAGAIAYIDFSGNFDSCITLRTMVLKNGKAYVQVGAGIVADSIPEAEYQETVNKGKALLRSIELAENNFEL